LVALRFDCEQAPRLLAAKGKNGKKAVTAPLELPEENPKLADQREEKELQYLKEQYPAEFAELYAAEREKAPDFLKGSGFSKIAAEGEALVKLREKYGIVK
jgi:hypothetical protein